MSKKRRVIETLKSLLIVGLIGSAVWLVGESQIFRMSGVLDGPRQNEGATNPASTQIQIVRPLQMAVMSQGGCFGVQHGSGDMDALFDRMAPLLNEALSSTDVPRAITQKKWEQSLVSAPGVYFDFQGSVPLQVLAAWLSGQENPHLTANVRHVLLIGDEGSGVELVYRDEDNGRYFACSAQLVSLNHLQSAVDQVTPNGAIFACQAANYRMLAPHTIIAAQIPQMREYAAANPLPAEEEARLTQLLEVLSFPQGITTVYETPEGRRARSGSDSLTVFNDGVVLYESTREEQRYPAAGAQGEYSLFAAVDSATRLARGALDLWKGAADVYLARVEPVSAQSWQLEFCYALDDVPVRAGQRGYAATVLVDRGYITQFELQLRSYTALEQTTLLLPQEQAAAALEELGRAGSQLQLRYQDGGELVRAGWIAGD